MAPKGLSLLLLPLASPWIYILHNYLFLFGGTKILHYVIFYLVFGTKRAQFASAPSSITMNIFLRYVIFYFVFGGTKSLSLLLLTSPWIYILFGILRWHQKGFCFSPSNITMNIFLHIRWHQNLTLCYFLFSIRWHQKGSVCFSPSNITMNIFLRCNFLFHIRWHQNLTLCYFLFPIRWHQKGSVCFCSL